MKRLIFLLAFLPLMLQGQQNSKIAANLLLSVQSGANALPGTNLVTNGGFDSDTWWSKNTGVTITSGVCRFTSVANEEGVYKASLLTASVTYVISFEITAYTGGEAKVYLGGSSYSCSATKVGKYSVTGKCSTGTDFYLFAGGTSTFDVDNIVIRELHASALTLPDPAYTLANTSCVPTFGHKGNSSYWSFSGSQYFSIPDADYLDMGTGDYSILLDFETGSDVTTQQTLEFKGLLGVSDKSYYIAIGTGKLSIFIGDGSGAYWINGNTFYGTVAANTRYHAILTLDRDGSQILYLNGTAVKTTTSSNSVDISSATTLTIGRYYVGATSYDLFLGKLYRVQHFNYALDGTAVTYYSNHANHLKAVDGDGTGDYCVLNLTAEGMLSQSLWRDYYNNIDVAVGTASTAPKLVKNWAGMNAWRFNGTSSYLSLVDASAPQLTGDITVSFWAMPTVLSNYNAIIINQKLNLYSTAAGLIWFFRDGSTKVETAEIFIVNTWQHIVITSTSTGYSQVYKNGVLISSGAAGTPVEGTGSLVIGNNGSFYFQGVLDGFKINSGIWSAEKIALAATIYE